MRLHSLPDGSVAERGGFEPPKPVSQFNGLANRKQIDATGQSIKYLRSISDGLPTNLPTDTCQTDPDLAEIVDAWPTLSEPIKAALVAWCVRLGRTSEIDRRVNVSR